MSDIPHPYLSTMKVEIMLKEPFCFDARSRMFVSDGGIEWTPLVFLTETTCNHQETACLSCVLEWSTDYWFRVSDYTGAVFTLNGAPGLLQLGKAVE